MNKYLEKLLAQRKEKADAMRALLAVAESDNNRSLTQDEATQYDALNKDIDSINADIKRTETQIKLDAELNQPQRNALTSSRENPADIPVDIKRYSLLRAVNAQITGNWDEAQYERECSLRIADNLKRDAKGIFVPYEVQRAVMATGAGAGFVDAGALVGTDHRDDLFVESLQADSFVVANGAKVLTGLVGDIDIPRALGGVSFTWVDEDGSPTDSAMNIDSIRMTPKTIAGSIPITRRLLKQSSPAVESLLQNDIRQGVALAIDAAVVGGDGAGGKPTGILYTTGVSTQTIANTITHVPTFEEVVGFETKLAESNALRGTLIYATTPAIAGATKVTPIDAGSGVMLNTKNEMNGYRVVSSTLVPSNKIIFGNFSDVVIGMWGVMDIVVDTAAKAASGGIVLRVFQDIDVAIRHPQSFCISA